LDEPKLEHFLLTIVSQNRQFYIFFSAKGKQLQTLLDSLLGSSATHVIMLSKSGSLKIAILILRDLAFSISSIIFCSFLQLSTAM